jgi:hypothetical protein
LWRHHRKLETGDVASIADDVWRLETGDVAAIYRLVRLQLMLLNQSSRCLHPRQQLVQLVP